MSEATIQSLIVGIVAILSSLIASTLPHHFQKRRNENKVKKEKLEEIYIDIENWYNSAFNLMCTEFSLVFNGHIDWNEYLDRLTNSEFRGDLKKTQIIIHLYFKELEKDMKNLHESVIDMNQHIDKKIKPLYLEGANINILRDAHYKKINYANRQMDILKGHMFRIARKL